MTTIPERIREDARRLLDSLGSCNCSECTETAAQALLAAEKRGREEAAKIAEKMPDQMLHFWDRPGGPPGNGYRPTTRADIAAAIRSTN